MTAEKAIRHMGCMSLWYHHRARRALRMGTDAHLVTTVLALKSKYIYIYMKKFYTESFKNYYPPGHLNTVHHTGILHWVMYIRTASISFTKLILKAF